MAGSCTRKRGGKRLRCISPRVVLRPRFFSNSDWMVSWYLLTLKVAANTRSAATTTTMKIPKPIKSLRIYLLLRFGKRCVTLDDCEVAEFGSATRFRGVRLGLGETL